MPDYTFEVREINSWARVATQILNKRLILISNCKLTQFERFRPINWELAPRGAALRKL